MEHPGGASTAHSSPLDHSWVARHDPKGEVISGSSAKSTLPWKLVLVALLGLLGALGWWSGVGRGSSVKATQVDPKQRRLFETW
jgi:hypothetical protein